MAKKRKSRKYTGKRLKDVRRARLQRMKKEKEEYFKKLGKKE